MKEFLTNDVVQIIMFILCVLMAAIFATVARFFNNKAKQIISTTENEKVANILSIVRDITYSCVISINQKYVNDLKDKGEFTDEKKKEALELAYNTIYNIVYRSLSKVIYNKVDQEKYIKMLIEEAVSNLKPIKGEEISTESFNLSDKELDAFKSYLDNNDTDYTYSSLEPKTEIEETKE